MNKAEKQHVADLEKALERALAFRRTPHTGPDIPVPAPGGVSPVYGFHVVNLTRVVAMWSTASAHGEADERNARAVACDNREHVYASQRGVFLHSKKSSALLELRHRVEEDFLNRVVALDKAIAEALEQEKETDR